MDTSKHHVILVITLCSSTTTIKITNHIKQRRRCTILYKTTLKISIMTFNIIFRIE